MNLCAEIKDVIIQNIELELPLDQINYDTDLLEIGLTSISFIRLLVLLEDKFDIEVDDSELDYENFSNINNLANMIQKMIDKKDC